MESLLKIAALLVAVSATSASDSCSIPEEGFLNCSGKGLSFPPPGYWPQTTTLDLSNNTIKELAKNSFSGFPALTDLYLSNNNLTNLNFEHFATNNNLSRLHIANNQINTFTSPPREIKFENLEHIEATNNKIARLDPDFFVFAPNLRELYISNNPLLVEAGHPVLNHPKMAELRMSFGNTDSNVVDSSFLSGLPRLSRVGLTFAGITSVDGAFVNNKLLQNIELQGNFINRITPGTFATDPILRVFYLNLSRNPLFKLEIAALKDSFSPSGFIVIHRTPLACECGYKELFKWATSRNIVVDATCSMYHNFHNCSAFYPQPPTD